jgi:prepilin-type N-terminal cleavage/methylation domain-containing protein
MKRAVAKSAFTLVEMLVVLAIIGTLMAIILPIVGKVKIAAKRAKAQQEIKSVELGIKAYQSEYGKFPLQDSMTEHAYTADYIDLMNTLAGVNTNANPRRIAFIELPQASMINNMFVDPWQKPYQVVADWSMDNIVTLAASNNYTPAALTGRVVAVWSFGPDGKGGSSPANANNDNLTSWK